MHPVTLVAVLASCFAFASSELAVDNDVLLWLGGEQKTLIESTAFCQSVSTGLIPVIWNTELRILEWSLRLPATGEEFWVGAKQEGDHMVWGEGSRIDSLIDGENKCTFTHCGLTVKKGTDNWIRFTVRNAEDKHRSLCRLYTKSTTGLPRLAELWKHLSVAERVTVSQKLSSEMIFVNSQRIQELEQKLAASA